MPMHDISDFQINKAGNLFVLSFSNTQKKHEVAVQLQKFMETNISVQEEANSISIYINANEPINSFIQLMTRANIVDQQELIPLFNNQTNVQVDNTSTSNSTKKRQRDETLEVTNRNNSLSNNTFQRQIEETQLWLRQQREQAQEYEKLRQALQQEVNNQWVNQIARSALYWQDQEDKRIRLSQLQSLSQEAISNLHNAGEVASDPLTSSKPIDEKADLSASRNNSNMFFQKQMQKNQLLRQAPSNEASFANNPKNSKNHYSSARRAKSFQMQVQNNQLERQREQAREDEQRRQLFQQEANTALANQPERIMLTPQQLSKQPPQVVVEQQSTTQVQLEAFPESEAAEDWFGFDNPTDLSNTVDTNQSELNNMGDASASQEPFESQIAPAASETSVPSIEDEEALFSSLEQGGVDDLKPIWANFFRDDEPTLLNSSEFDVPDWMMAPFEKH